jgi:hypothetical protein
MSTTMVEAPNGALMSFIERAAKDETFDVAKFETLLRVRRDEAHDHARRAFNAAMAACQSEMEPVLRVSDNPGVRSKYAKLEKIDQQMRPIYTRHGFSVRFGSAAPPQPGWMRITCTVAHDSGYFEENYLDSPVTTTGSQGGRIAMTPVQAVGSVVTYLRRYLLGMVFNIVQADVVGEDDDGEGMRAAAAPMPRPDKVVDPTVYDATKRAAKPIPRTGEQWNAWMDTFELDCASFNPAEHTRADLELMTKTSDFKAAYAAAPPPVRRDIDRILADAYGRLPELPADETETEKDTEPAMS